MAVRTVVGCALVAACLGQVVRQAPPLPGEPAQLSDSRDNVDQVYKGVPSLSDHVSKGLLDEPADAFEGGHEQDRDEVAKAQQLGAGIQPTETDRVIQEAHDFEKEHDLDSVIKPLNPEEQAAKDAERQKIQEAEETLTDVVNAPGMANMDSEQGRSPKFMGDSSPTSPHLHGAHMHKDSSPFSPVPLYSNPDFRADLDALRYADGNYSVAIQNIARTAMDAVKTTGKVFLGLVQDLYVKNAPTGKGSLANRSGMVSALYWKDAGEFKTTIQGVGCASPLKHPTTRMSELEAERMCNEMGQPCSGYSCNTEGERFTCELCSGVTKRMVHAWREIEKKPFFAMKSPDHMEWDHVVRRSRQWVEKFASLQKETEYLLTEERAAMEAKFQVMLERRATDPDFDVTNIAWKVRLDTAWRQEQYEEANWYAQLMRAEITRVDKFYNQVLNKLTQDINMVNVKEQGRWSHVNLTTLSSHNSSFDCWMAIRGVVYDFTYLGEHHPNKHSFIKNCGKDVTRLYDDLGHDGRPLTFLTKRVVGEFNRVGLNRTTARGNETVAGTSVSLERESNGLPSSAMMDMGEGAGSSSSWHDFTGTIHIMAAREQRKERSGSASLIALDAGDEDVGSVKPHGLFGSDADFVASILSMPLEREATHWPTPSTATAAAPRLLRRE